MFQGGDVSLEMIEYGAVEKCCKLRGSFIRSCVGERGVGTYLQARSCVTRRLKTPIVKLKSNSSKVEKVSSGNLRLQYKAISSRVHRISSKGILS